MEYSVIFVNGTVDVEYIASLVNNISCLESLREPESYSHWQLFDLLWSSEVCLNA